MTGWAVAVRDPEHAAKVRLAVRHHARGAGLPATAIHRAELAATELATNLLRHADGGVVLGSRTPGRFHVVAADRGPGIPLVEESMRDGVSTAGGLGMGLGIVRRAADEFAMYSMPATGTAIRASWRMPEPAGPLDPAGRLDQKSPPNPAPATTPAYAGMVMPAPGETVSGDGWWVGRSGPTTTLVVSDGLGHGPAAAEATRAVIDTVGLRPTAAPAALLDNAHRQALPTRGAAVAVGTIDAAAGTIRFAGIGNISARLYAADFGKHEDLISQPGAVGVASAGRRPTERVFAWRPRCWLVLHTDGLTDRWSSRSWPRLGEKDPVLVAGWILVQAHRHRDDACVLVLTDRRSPQP